jgi:hypothetical protein
VEVIVGFFGHRFSRRVHKPWGIQAASEKTPLAQPVTWCVTEDLNSFISVIYGQLPEAPYRRNGKNL